MSEQKSNRELNRQVKNQMISEGGPVTFNPEQVDSRVVIKPYEVPFFSSETLKNFQVFFESIPFDENKLEELLRSYVVTSGKSHDQGSLLGFVGELFLHDAIVLAKDTVSGIREFPEKYDTGTNIIAATDLGYSLLPRPKNGIQSFSESDQFDGLMQVQDKDGTWKTVMLESKISKYNSIERGLNSALSPEGSTKQTKSLTDTFGTIGYCVAGAKDRISNAIQVQNAFRANGGVLLAFPFTYQQAESISQNVLNALRK